MEPKVKLDKWAWDREHFALKRERGERDAYELMMFNTFRRQPLTESMFKELGETEVLPSGLTVVTRRARLGDVCQYQYLVLSDLGEVLDFRCEPKNDELPPLPRWEPTPENIAKLKSRLGRLR
jgi:hypothetical protein